MKDNCKKKEKKTSSWIFGFSIATALRFAFLRLIRSFVSYDFGFSLEGCVSKLSRFGVIRVNDEESNELLFLVRYEPIRGHGLNVIRRILWNSTHTTTKLN